MAFCGENRQNKRQTAISDCQYKTRGDQNQGLKMKRAHEECLCRSMAPLFALMRFSVVLLKPNTNSAIEPESSVLSVSLTRRNQAIKICLVDSGKICHLDLHPSRGHGVSTMPSLLPALRGDNWKKSVYMWKSVGVRWGQRLEVSKENLEDAFAAKENLGMPLKLIPH